MASINIKNGLTNLVKQNQQNKQQAAKAETILKPAAEKAVSLEQTMSDVALGKTSVNNALKTVTAEKAVTTNDNKTTVTIKQNGKTYKLTTNCSEVLSTIGKTGLMGKTTTTQRTDDIFQFEPITFDPVCPGNPIQPTTKIPEPELVTGMSNSECIYFVSRAFQEGKVSIDEATAFLRKHGASILGVKKCPEIYVKNYASTILRGLNDETVPSSIANDETVPSAIVTGGYESITYQFNGGYKFTITCSARAAEDSFNTIIRDPMYGYEISGNVGETKDLYYADEIQNKCKDTSIIDKYFYVAEKYDDKISTYALRDGFEYADFEKDIEAAKEAEAKKTADQKAVVDAIKSITKNDILDFCLWNYVEYRDPEDSNSVNGVKADGTKSVSGAGGASGASSASGIDKINLEDLKPYPNEFYMDVVDKLLGILANEWSSPYREMPFTFENMKNILKAESGIEDDKVLDAFTSVVVTAFFNSTNVGTVEYGMLIGNLDMYRHPDMNGPWDTPYTDTVKSQVKQLLETGTCPSGGGYDPQNPYSNPYWNPDMDKEERQLAEARYRTGGRPFSFESSDYYSHRNDRYSDGHYYYTDEYNLSNQQSGGKMFAYDVNTLISRLGYIISDKIKKTGVTVDSNYIQYILCELQSSFVDNTDLIGTITQTRGDTYDLSDPACIPTHPWNLVKVGLERLNKIVDESTKDGKYDITGNVAKDFLVKSYDMTKEEYKTKIENAYNVKPESLYGNINQFVVRTNQTRNLICVNKSLILEKVRSQIFEQCMEQGVPISQALIKKLDDCFYDLGKSGDTDYYMYGLNYHGWFFERSVINGNPDDPNAVNAYVKQIIGEVTSKANKVLNDFIEESIVPNKLELKTEEIKYNPNSNKTESEQYAKTVLKDMVISIVQEIKANGDKEVTYSDGSTLKLSDLGVMFYEMYNNEETFAAVVECAQSLSKSLGDAGLLGDSVNGVKADGTNYVSGAGGASASGNAGPRKMSADNGDDDRDDPSGWEYDPDGLPEIGGGVPWYTDEEGQLCSDFEGGWWISCIDSIWLDEVVCVAPDLSDAKGGAYNESDRGDDERDLDMADNHDNEKVEESQREYLTSALGFVWDVGSNLIPAGRAVACINTLRTYIDVANMPEVVKSQTNSFDTYVKEAQGVGSFFYGLLDGMMGLSTGEGIATMATGSAAGGAAATAGAAVGIDLLVTVGELIYDGPDNYDNSLHTMTGAFVESVQSGIIDKGNGQALFDALSGPGMR